MQDDTIKRIFESAIAKQRFSMPMMFRDLLAAATATGILKQHTAMTKTLGVSTADHVLKGVIRNTFLIELVKVPKIETTKFELRWSNRLERNDPRYASYDDCLQILDRILTDLEEAVDDIANQQFLQLLQTRSLLAYEIPIDYRERRSKEYIHRSDNVFWAWDDLIKRVVKLRSFLLNAESNPYALFFNAVYEKVKVKTYLTDRVLTGDHKTNREKRWEAHPESVHFALRRSCMGIEYTLINQLCHFLGFPTDLMRCLEDAGLLSQLEVPFRCPITMEPLSFTEFEREVNDPTHGKANFQVGHMNPLKAINDDPYSGHSAQNISWVSSDGNRIQGHLSLQETRALIQRIRRNYEQHGI